MSKERPRTAGRSSTGASTERIRDAWGSPSSCTILQVAMAPAGHRVPPGRLGDSEVAEHVGRALMRAHAHLAVLERGRRQRPVWRRICAPTPIRPMRGAGARARRLRRAPGRQFRNGARLAGRRYGARDPGGDGEREPPAATAAERSRAGGPAASLGTSGQADCGGAGLSTYGVRCHLRNLFAKLGARATEPKRCASPGRLARPPAAPERLRLAEIAGAATPHLR